MSSLGQKTLSLLSTMLVLTCLIAAPPSTGQKQEKINSDLDWAAVNSDRVSWSRQQANSDTILVDSLKVRIISGRNIIDATVAMAFVDQGDYFAVYVYFRNDGQERLEINPQQFRIAYWKNQDAYLDGKPGDWSYSVAPETIANKYKNRAEWKAFFARLAGGMATTTARTDHSGSISIRDGSGIASGTYSGTSTTTVRDKRAEVAAELNARRIIDNAQGDAALVLSTSLQGNTVFPGQRVSGWVYFQRKKIGLGEVILRVIRPTASLGPDAVDYYFLTRPGR